MQRDGNRDIHLFDVGRGKIVRALSGHREHIEYLAFSPDGKLLASLGDEDGIKLWDVATGKELARYPEHLDTFRHSGELAFSPDGKTLAVSSGDSNGVVHLLDVASGKETRRLCRPGQFRARGALAFSPDSRLLAVGASRENVVTVWGARDGQLAWEYTWEEDSGRKEIARYAEELIIGSGTNSLAFAADGRSLIAACHGMRVRVWEVASGGLRYRVDEHVRGLAVARTGSLFAGVVRQQHAYLWDARTCLPAAQPLAPPDGDKVWSGLAAKDAAMAYTLMRDLLAAPRQAAAILDQRLPTAPRPRRPSLRGSSATWTTTASRRARRPAAAWPSWGRSRGPPCRTPSRRGHRPRRVGASRSCSGCWTARRTAGACACSAPSKCWSAPPPRKPAACSSAWPGASLAPCSLARPGPPSNASTRTKSGRERHDSFPRFAVNNRAQAEVRWSGSSCTRTRLGRLSRKECIMSRARKPWLTGLWRSFRRPARSRTTFRRRPEVELLKGRWLLTTYWVINTDDTGAGSLRQAITQANADTQQPNTIRFDIGNADKKIEIKSGRLPPITHTVVIDGTPPPLTANPPSGNVYPKQTIRVTGTANVAAGSGFEFDAGADGSKIYGLTIDSSPQNGILLKKVKKVQVGAADSATIKGGRMVIYNNKWNGIQITGSAATGNTVVASYIGTDASFQTDLGNDRSGILIDGGASSNYVGVKGSNVGLGTVQKGLNVIAGNKGAGIKIDNSSENEISGTLVGLLPDAAKPAALANENGVVILGTSTLNSVGVKAAMMGTTIVSPANIISGNTNTGVTISATALPPEVTAGNMVQSNFIGLDQSGIKALKNGGDGVYVFASPGNLIGGIAAGLLNVIAGNGKNGIRLANAKSTGNVISSNLIGVGADRTANVPNGSSGVEGDRYGIKFDKGVSGNTVNDGLIVNNPDGKVYNPPPNKNTINDPNLMWGQGYGILDGTMAGAPVITSANRSGSTITINGTLDSTASTQFSLEFFGEMSAQRLGAYYLGTTTVTTDGSGHAAFNVTFTPAPPFSGDFITATATSLGTGGNTSEFSYDYSLSGAHLPAHVLLGAGGTVNPGVAFTQSGSFTDPGATSWTATVDYGDGTGAQPLALSGTTFTLSHTYAASGSYAVTVAVTGSSGAVGYGTLNVNVAGPVVSLDPVVTNGPGGALTGQGSFTDTGSTSATATVNYGDGSGTQPLTLNADHTFALSHTYAANGNYTIAVTVTDGAGLVGTATLPVNVLPPAPVVTLGSDTTVQTDGTFSQGGSFSDPYSSSWTATVDYGDGTGTQALALSGTTFNLSHTYANPGSYTVTVIVAGSSGAVGFGDQYITVLNTPPSVTVGSDVDITPGSAFSRNGSFTGSGFFYIATVDYGDGSGPQTLTLNAGRTFTLSHAYASSGNFAVTVTVIDDSGSAGTATLLVHALTGLPTATFSNSGPVPHGAPVAVSFTNQYDPPPGSGVFTYSYDFLNDGSFTDPGDAANVAAPSWSYVFNLPGVYTIHGRITDQSGAFTDYWTTVTVS